MSILKSAILLIALFQVCICQSQLLITELMVDPSPSRGLPEAEYIELTNFGEDTVNLADWEVSDKSKRVLLPNINALPGDIILISKNGTFDSSHDIQNHIQLTQIPSLNNSGDLISLINPSGDTVDFIDYTQNIDGSKEGFSLELINPSNSCLKNLNWSYSQNPIGGTPGKINSVNSNRLPVPILLETSITEDGVVQFLLDHPETIVEAYLELGDQIIHLNFDSLHQSFVANLAKQLSQSFDSGLLLHLTNCIDQPFDSLLSLGIPAPATSSDILINEILFNPRPESYDFIELYNHSPKIIDLSTLFLKDDNKDYPLSITQRLFFPGDYIVFTKDVQSLEFDYPNAIRSRLEETTLPPFYNKEGSILLCHQNGDTIDQLVYQSDWHHPLVHDDEGVSLERISWDNATQHPDNWHSASSNSGYMTPTLMNSQMMSTNSSSNRFDIHPSTITPNLDGDRDFLNIQFHLEKSGYLSTISLFNLEGKLLTIISNNQLLGRSDRLTWEPTVNGHLLATGVYLLYCEIHHPDGNNQRFKKSFVIAKN